jgi:ABC-type Fe3+-hydroxamate transport system substrate-binding protein
LVRRILLTLVLTLSAAGCGSGTSDSSETTTASTHTTAPAAPSQRILSEKELTEALLGVQDLPAGYSQDRPSENAADKTFCDYKPAFQVDEVTSAKRYAMPTSSINHTCWSGPIGA